MWVRNHIKQSALRSSGSNPGNHIAKDIKLQIKNNKTLIPPKTSCLWSCTAGEGWLVNIN
jgi:hypothetical protein